MMFAKPLAEMTAAELEETCKGIAGLPFPKGSDRDTQLQWMVTSIFARACDGAKNAEDVAAAKLAAATVLMSSAGAEEYRHHVARALGHPLTPETATGGR